MKTDRDFNKGFVGLLAILIVVAIIGILSAGKIYKSKGSGTLKSQIDIGLEAQQEAQDIVDTLNVRQSGLKNIVENAKKVATSSKSSPLLDL